jgi:hypothetical protein
MVRPREWDRAELLDALHKYIDETPIPIVAEFAAQNGLHRQQLYDMEELSDALKACTFKKEAGLERMALNGDVNSTMAIFSLKQLGWSDKQETTHKGDTTAPLIFSQTDAGL